MKNLNVETIGGTWRRNQKRDAECHRETPQGVNANVSLATFNAADIIPMQIGPRRQFLLRHARLLAQSPNATTDCPRQVHAGMVGGLNTIGLHTIVFIASA
jgi:hypothetical protein